MQSDPHFQQLFQSHPDWLFDLLGEPVPPNCQFSSPVLKAVQRQLDGYLTADGWPPTVVEFQMARDEVIYYRIGMELAQVGVQVHPQRPSAVIVFASANLDPRTEPWCGFIRSIYLDEALDRLAKEHPDHLLLSVLFPLLQADESKLVAEGPQHYHRVQSAIEPQQDRDILLRILTDFLFQRLPQYTHEQLAMMMKLTPLHETEGYKSMIRDATAEGMSKGMSKGLTEGLTQGLSQGRASVLIRQAKHRFPKADRTIDEAIRNLDFLQLEHLTDAILDLPDLPALRSWLKLD